MDTYIIEKNIKDIKFLQVEPTTYCNFSCSFCCGRHLPQKHMKLNDYIKCLDSFPALEYLELQGEGEPFLYPHFFEMVYIAKKRNIQISTITNGSLLLVHNNIGKIIDSGIDNISISLETADKIRFMKIRGGDLKNIISGIKMLVQEKKRI